jgi:hypothetical protein
VTNLNKLGGNVLTNPVFFHLDMMKAFGGTASRPIDTCLVVIVYSGSVWHEEMFNIEEPQ